MNKIETSTPLTIETSNPITADQHAEIVKTQQEQATLTFAGQRKVNLIWEYTQAVIALAVVAANLAVLIKIGFETGPHAEMPPSLSNTLFLVVGFYFSRTNHSAIGGVGPKPSQTYDGR
jgi:hypothetical protein